MQNTQEKTLAIHMMWHTNFVLVYNNYWRVHDESQFWFASWGFQFQLQRKRVQGCGFENNYGREGVAQIMQHCTHRQPLCYMCDKPNHQVIKCWHRKIGDLDKTTHYAEKQDLGEESYSNVLKSLYVTIIEIMDCI